MCAAYRVSVTFGPLVSRATRRVDKATISTTCRVAVWQNGDRARIRLLILARAILLILESSHNKSTHIQTRHRRHTREKRGSEEIANRGHTHTHT